MEEEKEEEEKGGGREGEGERERERERERETDRQTCLCMPTFFFSYSSIRLSKFSSPGRKRVEGWRKFRGITLVEPPPPGRKHHKLG